MRKILIYCFVFQNSRADRSDRARRMFGYKYLSITEALDKNPKYR